MFRDHENTLNFRWSYTFLPADLGIKVAQSQGTLKIAIPRWHILLAYMTGTVCRP
jgi:hypothetical protein